MLLIKYTSQKYKFYCNPLNSCECIKFLNIANIHASCGWGNAYLFAIIKYFSFAYFTVYSFCNANFLHSGCVIKPNTIYGVPPFTGHLNHIHNKY